jgi:membrane protein DedA with SNARE-associated domain
MKSSFFFTFLLLHPLGAYFALFLGMVIEGDLVLFTAGFLVHHNVLSLAPTFTSLFFGTIFGDLLWYLLGTTNTDQNKFLNWLGRSTDFAGQKVDAHVKDRTFRTLFISKFIYGTHHFTLVRAGRLGVPLRRFLRTDVIGSLLWVLIVSGLGYAASASFEKLHHRLHFIELALLLGVVLYFLVADIVGKVLKRRL